MTDVTLYKEITTVFDCESYWSYDKHQPIRVYHTTLRLRSHNFKLTK